MYRQRPPEVLSRDDRNSPNGPWPQQKSQRTSEADPNSTSMVRHIEVEMETHVTEQERKTDERAVADELCGEKIIAGGAEIRSRKNSGEEISELPDEAESSYCNTVECCEALLA